MLSNYFMLGGIINLYNSYWFEVLDYFGLCVNVSEIIFTIKYMYILYFALLFLPINT